MKMGKAMEIESDNSIVEEFIDMFIAIDFGTTNTCVAALQNGKVSVIGSDQGARQTPSWVAFEMNEGQPRPFVGREAKNYQNSDPGNTIYDLKRFVGCTLGELGNLVDKWPFELIEENGQLKVQIGVGATTSMTPEDIILIILLEMKKAAESSLRETCTAATITVPPYFDQNQKSLLEEAAERVHFTVSIIEEPIAAAYKFGLQNLKKHVENILVFHLGGKTLCVTILHFDEDGHLEIKNNGFAQDRTLGGDSFNDALVDYFIRDIWERRRVDIEKDATGLANLHNKCEEAKKILSRDMTTRLCISEYVDEDIGREKFDQLTNRLHGRIWRLIDDALTNAESNDEQISKVILVGGATRIPGVDKLLRNRFGWQKLEKDSNPDETVATGALTRMGVDCDAGETRDAETREMALGIGIDLGTTYSAIADGSKVTDKQASKVKIFEQEQGDAAIPSCVAFIESNDDIWVGKPAQNYGIKHPKNCIRGFKRIIGLAFDNPVVEEERKIWGNWDVVLGDNKAKFQVVHNGMYETFTPEEISAKILSELKQIAESKLNNMVVKDIVLGIPTRFRHDQRNATKDAARLAGLKVLEMIPEPAAAVLVHNLNVSRKRGRNVLVFDFGGGTLDIAIFHVDAAGNFYEQASSGLNNLGGEDITKNLTNLFLRKYIARYREDISRRREGESDEIYLKRMNSIREECENAKKNLSLNTKTHITFETRSIMIGRHSFIDANHAVFVNARRQIRDTLQAAKMEKRDIATAVLTGGTSRIPMMKKMIVHELNHTKIIMSDNPEEDVVTGAAIHAKMLQSGKNYLFGIAPLDLGIASSAKVMEVVIPRGNPIPSTTTHTFKMECDKDGGVTVSVYEGDSVMATKNMLLGQFKIRGSRKQRTGLVDVEVTFSIQRYRLKVYGRLPGSHHKKSPEVTLQLKSADKTNEEVRQMKEDAMRNKEADELLEKNAKETLKARTELRNLADKHMSWKRLGRRQTEKTTEILQWIQDNPDASLEDIKHKKLELEAGLRLGEEATAETIRSRMRPLTIGLPTPGISLQPVAVDTKIMDKDRPSNTMPQEHGAVTAQILDMDSTSTQAKPLLVESVSSTFLHQDASLEDIKHKKLELEAGLRLGEEATAETIRSRMRPLTIGLPTPGISLQPVAVDTKIMDKDRPSNTMPQEHGAVTAQILDMDSTSTQAKPLLVESVSSTFLHQDASLEDIKHKKLELEAGLRLGEEATAETIRSRMRPLTIGLPTPGISLQPVAVDTKIMDKDRPSNTMPQEHGAVTAQILDMDSTSTQAKPLLVESVSSTFLHQLQEERQETLDNEGMSASNMQGDKESIVASESKNVPISKEGGEIDVGGCAVTFHQGSFDAVSKVHAKSEIDSSKWPPKYICISAMLWVHSERPLLKRASVAMKSWCMKNSRDSRKIEVHVLHLKNGSSTWDVVARLPLNDLKVFHFDCADFSPYVLGVSEDDLTAANHVIEGHIYAGKGNNFSLAFFLQHDLIKKSVTDDMALKQTEFQLNFSPISVTPNDLISANLKCTDENFRFRSDFKIDFSIDGEFVRLTKKAFSHSYLIGTSNEAIDIPLECEVQRNESLADGPHYFNYEWRPKIAPQRQQPGLTRVIAEIEGAATIQNLHLLGTGNTHDHRQYPSPGSAEMNTGGSRQSQQDRPSS